MKYRINLHHYLLFVLVLAVWLRFARDLHAWLAHGIAPPPLF